MNLILTRAYVAHPGKNWDHMIFSDQMSPEFIPIGDGTYELVLVVRLLPIPPFLPLTFLDRRTMAGNLSL